MEEDTVGKRQSEKLREQQGRGLGSPAGGGTPDDVDPGVALEKLKRIIQPNVIDNLREKAKKYDRTSRT